MEVMAKRAPLKPGAAAGETQADAAAATKIQATFRGKQARKDVRRAWSARACSYYSSSQVL